MTKGPFAEYQRVRNLHSIVLMQRVLVGWVYAKTYEGETVVMNNVTLEKMAWLNTTCRADWKWILND